MALEDVIQGQVDTQIKGEVGDSGDPVDAGDTGVETPVETAQDGAGSTNVDAGDDPVQKAAEDARKAAEEAEQNFAKEYDLLDKMGKRENRIPYTRVKKIVENAQIKLAKMVMGDQWKDLPPGTKLDDVITGHVKSITDRLANYDAYEREVKSMETVGQMMQTDPERFLSMLPHVNPRYAELLARQERAERQMAQDDPMPGPDLDLGNGAKTYSPEGLQKLLDWQAQQTQKRVLGEVEKNYKPIKDTFEAQGAMAASLERVRTKLQDARQNWKGFTQHEDAIRKEVEAGADLHVAYVRVMDRVREQELAAAKADREKIRAEVLEELKRAPKSTSTSVSSRNPKADEVDGAVAGSLEDVIKNAWKGNKG